MQYMMASFETKSNISEHWPTHGMNLEKVGGRTRQDLGAGGPPHPQRPRGELRRAGAAVISLLLYPLHLAVHCTSLWSKNWKQPNCPATGDD